MFLWSRFSLDSDSECTFMSLCPFACIGPPFYALCTEAENGVFFLWCLTASWWQHTIRYWHLDQVWSSLYPNSATFREPGTFVIGWDFPICHPDDVGSKMSQLNLIEGSLNSKLPTIWRVEKEMKSRWDEVKSRERRCNSRESQKKEDSRRAKC